MVVPRGSTKLDSCEPLVTLAIKPIETKYYVCFCLKIPYLMHIVDPLTLNSWPVVLVTPYV